MMLRMCAVILTVLLMSACGVKNAPEHPSENYPRTYPVK
jgi:outer membrane lipoprotein-sorting protein